MEIPSQEAALKFIHEIADLRKDGEPDDEGEEWTMENDDAYETVNSLISEARGLLGMPETIELDDDERTFVENDDPNSSRLGGA